VKNGSLKRKRSSKGNWWTNSVAVRDFFITCTTLQGVQLAEGD
jgi:hypothetical protein